MPQMHHLPLIMFRAFLSLLATRVALVVRVPRRIGTVHRIVKTKASGHLDHSISRVHVVGLPSELSEAPQRKTGARIRPDLGPTYRATAPVPRPYPGHRTHHSDLFERRNIFPETRQEEAEKQAILQTCPSLKDRKIALS